MLTLTVKNLKCLENMILHKRNNEIADTDYLTKKGVKLNKDDMEIEKAERYRLRK